MKGKIILGIISGVCAGYIICKHKKEIKERVVEMKNEVVEAVYNIYKNATEEDALDAAIREAEERKYEKIKEKDNDEALEELNNIKFKKVIKKGIIVAGGGIGLGIVIIAKGFLEYKL